MPAPHIALASATAARSLDDDLLPLDRALRDAGAEVVIADWDDSAFDWSSVDLALLRSTWDYAERLPEFLAWAERVAASTRLLNPPDVLRWNTDKHYLADLERAGVAYRKFKRPFRAVCWVGGGRASPVLGTDRTSVSGISASRGHAAALSAAMLR